MKVIILAGGFGTRLESITELVPKPMVPIGGMPILWHIMKTYAHYGYSEFVVPLGYKGEVVKDFFYHYAMVSRDFTIEIPKGDIEYHNLNDKTAWKVTLADTGMYALKGARIKRIERYLDSDVNMLTYGDGLADIDIGKLVDFHTSHGKILTVTGVHPPSLFGELIESDGSVAAFSEKPQSSQGLINGGFMVFDRRMFEYLDDSEDCDFEIGALHALTQDSEVRVYKHEGSWMCMDNKRDLEYLDRLWREKRAFWRVWD